MIPNGGWLLVAMGLVTVVAAAGPAPRHMDLKPSTVRAIRSHQKRQSQYHGPRVAEVPVRPYSELEAAGYLLMSAAQDFDSGAAKREMLANLPAGVTAVLFIERGQDSGQVRGEYGDVISQDRLKIVELYDAGSGFWARDGLPVPAWRSTRELALVDARYYHNFEPDSEVASWFQALLIRNEYYFEGGNFVTNDAGACLTVDNQLSQQIPTDTFFDLYGCRRVVRLNFEKGIGHADESVRFVSQNEVLTDSESYAQDLRREGFSAVKLPRPSRQFETYVNSLLVNDTVFVPTFGESTDEAALNVYRGLGLRVVGLPSSTLSNRGRGSIHCITMTYPPVPFHSLLKGLGAQEI